MKFECGCEYDKLDFENVKVPLDCPRTWDFISTGLTKGVFQLEKSLGRRYTKEIQPRNIEQLADVISLIRPGCLEAEFREDEKNPGKWFSITDTYIKTKRGELKAEYLDPCLESIFANTFGVPVYQEQLMRICSDYAGFTLKEADDTRKAVGKKLKDKMAAIESKFVDGAKKLGHDEATARTIFGWIDKFSGYGFNKSHAVSYALIGYLTAYSKVHFPLEFFKAMLTNSDGKQDSLEEIQELVHEAKLFNIDVRPPNLALMNDDFAIQDEKTIAFGLAHIKGVGQSSIAALRKVHAAKTPREFLILAYPEKAKPEKKKKTVEDRANEIMLDAAMKGEQQCLQKAVDQAIEEEEKAVEKPKKEKGKLNKTVVEALIKSGSLDHLNKNRIKFLECYRIMGEMTDKERRIFVTEHYKPDVKFEDALKSFLVAPKAVTDARKPKLMAAIQNYRSEFLGANPKKQNIAWEKFYLGVPLSGSLVELYYNPKVDTKIRNLIRLKNGFYHMGVVIEGVDAFKDKNGNMMCFLKVSDETYMMEKVCVFSKAYMENAWIIEEGKPVLISGRKEKDSFFVNKIEHL
jgi:DNA polymerase III alpha subunit